MADPEASPSKPEAEEYVAYAFIARKRLGDRVVQTLRTSSNLTRLIDWAEADEEPNDSKEGRPQDGEEEVSEKPERLADVGKGVWHFYEQLKSYYELAEVLDAIPGIFTGAFFKSTIQRYAEERLPQVAMAGSSPIYGLNSAEMSRIHKSVKRWNDIEAGFSKLPASTLLSLVASFDSAFAEFAKALLRNRPQRYTGSDRSYSVGQILALGSLDGLIEKVIEDEIDQIMNKSHTDQIAFFEKSFDVKIIGEYDRWPDFIEVFERRNLAAHGNLCVNERYLRNCKVAGYDVNATELNKKLLINSKYLKEATDVLIEFGVLLAFAAWQKQSPQSSEDTFSAVVEISFDLLIEEHPDVAARILGYALGIKKKGASDVNRKIMIVNLAIALKMLGKSDDAMAILDGEDWSAANPDFKMCVASVREDVELACKFMPLVKAGDQIGAEEVRDWPAFQWVRTDPKFIEKAEEVFGERFGTIADKSEQTEGPTAKTKQSSDLARAQGSPRRKAAPRKVKSPEGMSTSPR